ncbi:MAG TPA: histidine kinase dimerization/phosphoacceptor domain -containing protein [Bacteroidia bacterium]|jgi:two-component sensor histidine kinase/predicted hydrocarbon binding protein|nr:histidine kinase dimerization/phosphoacceptor domain -containing protein [Bacteroidia bacterium]
MKQGAEKKIEQLKKEILLLQKENRALKRSFSLRTDKHTVKVPRHVKPIFDKAEKLVGQYFKSLKFSPSKGSIEINHERYVLVRASALSHEFLNSFKQLYKDRGDEEATNIGKNILFDVSHVLGLEDARNFHKKMNLKDPISKLSAGPVHFAYAGWAFVDILAESNPSPNDNFFLKYHHPYSFEADSWVRAGKRSTSPVCIMNSGYSSGWCEASFGISLTAVEISCKAKGDKHCTFIMAPPHKIDLYLEKQGSKKAKNKVEIPAFLERKKIEEKLNASLNEKEFLIKEIHHRVKNNLQIISSLLNLQAGSIRDRETKEKYTESIGRIKSMAIIHELLYRSKDLSNIKIKEYLKELVSFISNTYNLGKQIKVSLQVNIKRDFIDLDKAIPCGIIINELLSNAFKYAFEEKKQGGAIHIEFRENNGIYKLIVSDNGIGLPNKIDVRSSPTLGLQLINSLVEQLSGDLSIQNKNGTSFVISFP